MRELLDELGSGGVFGITFVLLMIASELGFHTSRNEADEKRKGESLALLGGMIGLLAFLLGFTFSIAQQRQLDRNLLVVDEANAIGTTYLRAGMLPPEHALKARQLLRDYVELRLGLRWREGFERKLARSETLQDALWREAEACAAELPTSLPVSLFIASLNELIDVSAERLNAGVYRRLPIAIVITMFVVAVLTLFVHGHTSALARARALLPTVAVTLSVAAVFALILDLDRPRQMMFHVDQHALLDLQRSMKTLP